MVSYTWVFDVLIIAVLLYVFSYVRKKGENQATRDDVGKITATVESIKSEYALLLEDVRGRNLLRLAALDKRLAAHQEAYTLLREACQQTGKPDFVKQINKAQEWWLANCLYLDKNSRGAFFHATWQLATRDDLLRTQLPRSKEVMAQLEKMAADIEKAFTLIIEGTDLPPIKEELAMRELATP